MILFTQNRKDLLPKYSLFRDKIETGDIILFRGKSILSKTIQFFDKSYYNHIGIAYWSYGRLFIVDSNENGVRPDFMSYRMRDYVDFCVIRPKHIVMFKITCLEKCLELGENVARYDFLLLLRIACKKYFNIDLKRLGDKSRYICSEYVQYYTNHLGDEKYKNVQFPSPEDFIRNRDSNYFSLLFNDKI